MTCFFSPLLEPLLLTKINSIHTSSGIANMAANMRTILYAGALAVVLAASHQQGLRGQAALDHSSHKDDIIRRMFDGLSIGNMFGGSSFLSEPKQEPAALSEAEHDGKDNATQGHVFSVPLNSELQTKSEPHPAGNARVDRNGAV
eukprot:TRINITY_DN106588_c0_g1_i1.p1 TRINITY_DN106588_c0_g1~~TRINITY_DN106588_c0_g1_i1.p1  ORF type:complete len:145 (-),score=20.22 TRINITY_DN106588_c0_g1_i1:109-543(-)